MNYGYEPTLVIQTAGSPPQTIRPRTLHRCCLPLAALANVGGVLLDFFADLPEASQALSLLRTPFEALLTRTPPRSRLVSRHFTHDDLQVILAVARRIPKVTAAHVSRWFKVPKASGTHARLVQNLHLLSTGLNTSNFRTPFSHIHAIARQLLASDAVVLADFANWFYQIPITESWSKFFQANIAVGRGAFVSVELQVLSMGLAISVFIAHCLALAFVRPAARLVSADVFSDAWVDNLVGGGSVQHAQALSRSLERLASEAHVAWSSPPTVHTESFVFLGLKFDLQRKTVGPTADTISKLHRNLERLQRASLRDLLSVVGMLVWLNFVVVRCPMAFLESLLDWLRRAATRMDELDRPARFPEAVHADIVRFTHWTCEASLSLSDLDPPSCRELTLFSDASNIALGAVYREGKHLTVRSWPADESLIIYVRELLAHVRGIQMVPRNISAVGAGLDNTNALAALRRGHSVNAIVNQLLRFYYAHLEHRGLHVSTCFVPTVGMLADFPSRSLPLPSNALDYFRQHSPLWPLPFFRLPPWITEGGGGEEEIQFS